MMVPFFTVDGMALCDGTTFGGIAEFAGIFSAVLKNDGVLFWRLTVFRFFTVLSLAVLQNNGTTFGGRRYSNACRARMEHAGKMQCAKPTIKSSNRHISNRQTDSHARSDLQQEENRKQAATTPETDKLV